MANKVKIPRNNLQSTPAKVEEPVLVPVEESPTVTVKRVLKSKTIWVNLISFLAFLIQRQYGFVVDEALQMQALTLINIALRFVTKEPIAWGGSENGNSKEIS